MSRPCVLSLLEKGFTGFDVGDDQLRTRLVGAMRAAGERVLHDRVANGQGG